jgi:hypothetical protein
MLKALIREPTETWLGNLALPGNAAPSGPRPILPEWLSKNAAHKPPDFGILDESGFFNRDSGAFKRIS